MRQYREEQEEEDDAVLFEQHCAVGFLSGVVMKEKVAHETPAKGDRATRLFPELHGDRATRISHRADSAPAAADRAMRMSHRISIGTTAAADRVTTSGVATPGDHVTRVGTDKSSKKNRPSFNTIAPVSSSSSASAASDNTLEARGNASSFQPKGSQESATLFPPNLEGDRPRRFSLISHAFGEGAESVAVNVSVKATSLHSRVSRLVNSSSFDYAVGCMVLLNAGAIGAQVDWDARNPTEATPITYKAINWIFCGLFTFELALRLITFGRKFFRNGDWKWNVFDFTIVVCQLAEELTSTIVDYFIGSDLGSEYTNFTLVRVLRVLRLVRIMRFMRILRLIRELHTMVGSIIGSLRSFMWTVGLLFGLIYIVGVYITQIVADHMRSDPDPSDVDPALRRYYGSLGSSVLSLFQALSGGVDWEALITPLDAVSSSVFIALFFSAYIAFSMFVMLNLVTGIFVDSAQRNIREDRDLELVNRVHELFIKADDDHSGKISWEEFEEQLINPEMMEYFKTIDLDTSEACYLFELLDVEGAGAISSEAFVNGCLRMRGPAKSYDLASHIRWTRKVSQRMLSGIRQLETQIEICVREQRVIAEEMKIDLDLEARKLLHVRSRDL